MYKYNFVSECFDIDAVMVDMDKNFLKRCFPQPTVCILYSLLSKAIHTGSVPGIITFICQFVTPILGATLLLYAAFIDLNRFAVLSVCFLPASFFVCMFYCLFYFCTIALVTAFISVACTSVTCFSIKYSILNTSITFSIKQDVYTTGATDIYCRLHLVLRLMRTHHMHTTTHSLQLNRQSLCEWCETREQTYLIELANKTALN